MKSLFRLPLLSMVTALMASGTAVRAQLDFVPPNDLFANRTSLGSGEAVEVSQKVLIASSEFGDPLENSVWWEWTAPDDGWWEVEMHPESDIMVYAPLVQVYQGDSLDTMVTASDGGLAPPQPSTGRRLFHAGRDARYQIGVTNPYPPYPDIRFAIRPAGIANNTSFEARRRLTPLNGTSPAGPWGGNGWSVRAADAPFTTPGGRTLFAPLFWEWTCPEDGHYVCAAISPSAYEQTATAAFRNQEITAAGEVPANDQFAASAGETFLLVTGAAHQAANAVQYHDLQVIRPLEDTGPPSNYSTPWPIQGPLPVTLTPPTNAPQSFELYWTWSCQETGWVEFDGGSLVPIVSGMFPSAIVPPVLATAGRRYFWVVPGLYSLCINGWEWPARGSFTLRKNSPPAPPNDAIANATPLGKDRTATASGTLLGSTRELGDPPARQSGYPLPTVWHQWQPSGGGGTAAVYLSWSGGDLSDIMDLRVFSGGDPAFFTEVPVTGTGPDSFGPGHFQFPVTGSAVTYWLCLAGRAADYELHAALSPSGITGTTHPNTYVISLGSGGTVREAMALQEPGDTNLFTWTATDDGAFTWLTSAPALRVTKGGDIRVQYMVHDNAAQPLPTPVKKGEVYWFRCLPDNATSGKPYSQRLRLMFSPAKNPVPGDDAANAISLGSQLPLQTACPIFAATVSPSERALSRPSVSEKLAKALWYSWTAPPETAGCEITAYSLGCEVFADGPQGPRVASADPHTADGDTFFVPQPGRTYFIMVQATAGILLSDKMMFSMRRYLTPPAANDDFANAGLPGMSRYGDADNRFRFSAEEGEPPPDPSQPALNRSAWWKWTAPESGIYRMIYPFRQPLDSGSILGSYTRVFAAAVYQSNGAGSGFRSLSRVSGISATNHPDTNSYLSHFRTTSDRSFTFQAESGREYYLQAASADEFGGLAVAVLPGDAYDAWSMNRAGLDALQSGPDRNPSGDGMSNLLKFCLGLDPARSLTSDPAASRAPAFSMAQDGSALQYTFWSDRFNTGFQIPFPANGSPVFANTARLVAERSSDLENWTRVTDAESLGGNRWRVTLPLNGTQPKRFVRLRAEWVLPSWPQ
ncbi:MAG: peptidase and in kexin sedolisin [Verrucomicrobiales bacterium]|nr:peptidase and in kexin sedolisin [Verrucomicrobiales bacterium]